jgi:hypothetical protein
LQILWYQLESNMKSPEVRCSDVAAGKLIAAAPPLPFFNTAQHPVVRRFLEKALAFG